MTITARTAFLFRSDNRKSAIQNPKWVGIFAIALTLVFGGAVALAQQPTKIPRIGFQLDNPASAIAARIEGFRQGLRELGYIQGKNIIIEWRSSEGKIGRSDIAAELVRLKVDVIVSAGPTITRTLKEATSTIPIVMGQDTDPVGSGFVASLARSGGNITGLSALSPEMIGKQLELLKEIVPKRSRVAVFGTSTSPDNAQSLKEVEIAARGLKVQLQHLEIRDAKDSKGIETAFRAASKGRAEAVLMMGAPVVTGANRTQIVELAVKSRLPVIYSGPAIVEAGGLMFYGVNVIDLDRRAAVYVDKILKGAKPGDLPVEQPTKFEFIINLKAAKQIGLTIPPNVLVRAYRVIK